ncbi:kinetochore-associated Ndc80 complex subunit spc25 [Tulasnella sp. 418]|nr:kinetochore-associated Ndc80 complex subunit spc25 [Tulasnella sp. 418]
MADRLMYQPFQLANVLQSNTPTLETGYDQCAMGQGAFMIALQNYVAKAKDEIKARKDTFNKRIQEDEERKKEIEKEVEECAVKEVKMIEQVQKEKVETAELEADVASLQKQESKIKELCARKDEEIEELKRKIFVTRGALNRDKEVLNSYAKRTAREGRSLQELLGWTIEGVQKDMLLFRFTRIDPSDSEREFSLVLDVSQRDYRVTTSTPLLPTLPTLLAELNESRQFYVFVRRIRGAFVSYVEEEKRVRT